MTFNPEADLKSRAGQRRRRLLLVFGLTSFYMVAEAVAGFLTGSLALLADAGHMLTDAGALGLSLWAVWFAERGPNEQRTFGYYRAEILAALANAVVLFLLSVYIVYEAWRRFHNPEVVASGPMLIVATIGIGVNLLGIWLLRESSAKSLNVRAAYLEVMSDLLGSVGVIVAALIVLTTKWYKADAIIAAAIGLFIVPRTWTLLKEATGVLMQGTPQNVDLNKLMMVMRRDHDVTDVHDLHVWSLTSGVNAMTAHVWIREAADPTRVLRNLQTTIKKEFEIDHTTLQIEKRCESRESF